MKFSLTLKPKKIPKKKSLMWNPIHPYRDWKRVMLIFTLLALAVVAWSTYLYYSSQNASIPQIMAAPQDSGTTAQAQSIKSFFDKRAQNAILTPEEDSMPL